MKMTAFSLSASLSLAALMLRPTPADACSVAAQPITSSLPLSGARDVPIDVAPVIRGHGDPQLLRWEAQDGTPVAFDIHKGPSADFAEARAVELVPRTPLRPNTTYTVRARMAGATRPGGEASLVFTTGTMMAIDAPAADPPLAATVLTTPPNMCSADTHAGCIYGGQDSVLLEITDATGQPLVRDVVSADALVYLTDPHCIRTTARSASGRLSGVSEVCGDALKIRPARGELDGTHPCRHGGFQPARAATLEVDEVDEVDAAAPAAPVANAGTSTSQEAITAASADETHSLSGEDGGCALASGHGSTRNSSLLALLLTRWLRARRRRG